jgi:hypothetical protein
MGNFVVSPATHLTECGRYRASFSVHPLRGNASECGVFHLAQAFESREAARLVAVTQGWLQTSMPHALTA